MGAYILMIMDEWLIEYFISSSRRKSTGKYSSDTRSNNRIYTQESTMSCLHWGLLYSIKGQTYTVLCKTAYYMCHLPKQKYSNKNEKTLTL